MNQSCRSLLLNALVLTSAGSMAAPTAPLKEALGRSCFTSYLHRAYQINSQTTAAVGLGLAPLTGASSLLFLSSGVLVSTGLWGVLDDATHQEVTSVHQAKNFSNNIDRNLRSLLVMPNSDGYFDAAEAILWSFYMEQYPEWKKRTVSLVGSTAQERKSLLKNIANENISIKFPTQQVQERGLQVSIRQLMSSWLNLEQRLSKELVFISPPSNEQRLATFNHLLAGQDVCLNLRRPFSKNKLIALFKQNYTLDLEQKFEKPEGVELLKINIDIKGFATFPLSIALRQDKTIATEAIGSLEKQSDSLSLVIKFIPVQRNSLLKFLGKMWDKKGVADQTIEAFDQLSHQDAKIIPLKDIYQLAKSKTEISIPHLPIPILVSIKPIAINTLDFEIRLKLPEQFSISTTTPEKTTYREILIASQLQDVIELDGQGWLKLNEQPTPLRPVMSTSNKLNPSDNNYFKKFRSLDVHYKLPLGASRAKLDRRREFSVR